MGKIGKIPVGAIIAIGTTFFNVANLVINTLALLKSKLATRVTTIEAEIDKITARSAQNRNTIT